MTRSGRGFTLVEVLVALVILLIGAYVALRIFPAGFQAIERARLESVAARLADQEIQRWQLAAGSLPEAIVWADSRTGSLIYNATYDPNDVRPNAGEPFTDANGNGVWDTGEPYQDLNANGAYGRPNPNWQPNSCYLPRTIIGEVLPVGDATDPDLNAIQVPLCRLRFGPLQHLYDNPADGDPLFIYTTEYERVDRVGFLSPDKDWGRYYIDYDAGTISFDYADYDRQFRVEFIYLTSAGPGAAAERRYEMWETTEMIAVPAGWDTRSDPLPLWPHVDIAASPAGAARAANVVTITTLAAHGFAVGQTVVVSGVASVGGTSFNGTFAITGVTATTFTYDQTEVDDTGGGGTAGTLPGDFQGVVPLSERVHQSFIFDGSGTPSGAGHFALAGDIGDPDGALLFDPADAGRTVNVDYRVRDWEILLEERTPDASLQIQLSVTPVKSPTYVNPPRQPTAPDRLIPGDDDMVIIIDADDGSRLSYVEGAPAGSDFTVDYTTGAIKLTGNGVAPEPEAGKTYRIYYRSREDWSIQPMKAAADYAVMVDATPGYRSAVLTANAGMYELDFGRSEVAKSIVANYYYRPESDGSKLVSGELHQVSLVGGGAVVQLPVRDDEPMWDIRVRGASMRARVLWAGRGSTEAIGGQISPERWQQVAVETFLRRQ